MEALSGLALGFEQVFQPFNLAICLLGVTLGLVVGVLPGLGGTSGVAILLPITVFIAPTAAIMLLAGIYWGALFGGVVTSILFNIPGEPWTVALVFDGHPMAKAGKAGLALTAAFLASLVSAMIGTLLFTFFAVPLANFALSFGPPEIFAIMLLAFGTFVGLGGGSPLKTVVMMCAGFLLAAVGLDLVTGQPRLTFGSVELLTGFHFVPVTIGLFGIGEILASAEEKVAPTERIAARLGLHDLVESMKELLHRWRFAVGTSLIGFWTGILPGTGATPASFMAYGLARQYSPNKEQFGKGAIDGVMAPQLGANAAGVGAVLPMITLGVPGSPTAAVIMAGLFIWGLTPGPTLFTEQRELVWGLIASLYVSFAFAFIVCMLAVPALAAIMRAPYALLAPTIVVLSVLGAYAINNSLLDVLIMLAFGVIGFILTKLKYPLAPLVVAIVLGASTENALRQSLIMSGGSLSILFERTLSGAIMTVAILFFMLPVIRTVMAYTRKPAPRIEQTPS